MAQKESRLNFSFKDNCFIFCDQIETAKECWDVKNHWKHRSLVSNTKYPCDQGFLRNCTRSWLWSDAKYRSAEEHRPRVPRGLLPKLSSQSLTFNFRLDLQLSSQLLQSNFWLSPQPPTPFEQNQPLEQWSCPKSCPLLHWAWNLFSPSFKKAIFYHCFQFDFLIICLHFL